MVSVQVCWTWLFIHELLTGPSWVIFATQRFWLCSTHQGWKIAYNKQFNSCAFKVRQPKRKKLLSSSSCVTYNIKPPIILYFHFTSNENFDRNSIVVFTPLTIISHVHLWYFHSIFVSMIRLARYEVGLNWAKSRSTQWWTIRGVTDIRNQLAFILIFTGFMNHFQWIDAFHCNAGIFEWFFRTCDTDFLALPSPQITTKKY